MVNNIKNYTAILLSMIFWSLSFVWIKTALATYGPITVTSFRLVISVGLLFVILSVTGKLNKLRREDFKLMLLLAFFEPFMYFMGETFGMSMVSSTTGAVIISTIPVLTPIAAIFFTNEKISANKYLGIIISFIGVGLVVMTPDLNFGASSKGVSLLFMAVAAGISYSVVLKRIAHKYNALSIILYQNFFGLLYFIPFFLIFDYKHFVSTPFDKETILVIAKLAIFASTLAFTFFTYSVKKLGINTSNTFTNLIPVFTAFFAFLINDTVPTIQNGIGIGIVICGLFLSQIRFKKPQRALIPSK